MYTRYSKNGTGKVPLHYYAVPKRICIGEFGRGVSVVSIPTKRFKLWPLMSAAFKI